MNKCALRHILIEIWFSITWSWLKPILSKWCPQSWIIWTGVVYCPLTRSWVECSHILVLHILFFPDKANNQWTISHFLRTSRKQEMITKWYIHFTFNERLFLGFLKEDLFYFFSKIIFSEIFAFAILLLCTLFDQVWYTYSTGSSTLFDWVRYTRKLLHYLPKITLHWIKEKWAKEILHFEFTNQFWINFDKVSCDIHPLKVV